MKRKDKQAAYFKCITKDCQAILNLKVKDDVIIEPFNIKNINSVQKYETCKKDDWSAKPAVENNASLPVQQIYEAQRVKERAHSDTAFPDFNDVRSTMTRIKTKKANLCKGRNINEVIVKNKLIVDGKKFLISDNNKKIV